MGNVAVGILVRALYSLGILALTLVVVVMQEGSIVASMYWMLLAGIIVIAVEFIITYKKTRGYDWRWANPASAVFSVFGLIAIWSLQLRFQTYSEQGVYLCVNHTAQEEFRKIEMTLASDWMDLCACGHCNGGAEQFFVILLLIGRYYLPRGIAMYNPADNINNFLKSICKMHFILALTCNGADVLDVISYTRAQGVIGNHQIISLILILFSLGLIQFSLDTHATMEEKKSDIFIVVETDLWASFVILLTDDLPFLFLRIFLFANYQVMGAFSVLFIFKNLLMFFTTLHKAVILYSSKDLPDIEGFMDVDPYTPPTKRHASRMTSSPDDLDDMSDNDSIYSNEIPVKSRNEKRKDSKANGWGSRSSWSNGASKGALERVGKGSLTRVKMDELASTRASLQESTINMDEKDLAVSQVTVQANGPSEGSPMFTSQAFSINGSQDWSARTVYFTETYANERESKMDASKVGSRKAIPIPLGSAKVRGHIDFSLLPKPRTHWRDIERKLIGSAKPDEDWSVAVRQEAAIELKSTSAKHKPVKEQMDEPDQNDSTKNKEQDKGRKEDKRQDMDQDDDIDDIIKAVDEEITQKKKKKHKAKEEVKDKETNQEEDADEHRDDKEGRRERSSREKKKKKDKHNEEHGDEAEENNAHSHSGKKKRRSKSRQTDDE